MDNCKKCQAKLTGEREKLFKLCDWHIMIVSRLNPEELVPEENP